MSKLEPLASLLVRVGLAVIIGWAGAQKLLDPSSLAAAIANYQLLPAVLVGPLAVTLPVLEVVVAGALLVGPCVRGAAVLSSAMLVVFAIAMAQARIRGIDLECGCLGAGAEAQVSWMLVVRNAALSAAGLWVVVVPVARFGDLLPRRAASVESGE